MAFYLWPINWPWISSIRDTLSIQCRVSAVFDVIVFLFSPPASVRLYVIKVDVLLTPRSTLCVKKR